MLIRGLERKMRGQERKLQLCASMPIHSIWKTLFQLFHAVLHQVGADLGTPGGYMPSIKKSTADINVQIVFCNAGYILSGFFYSRWGQQYHNPALMAVHVVTCRGNQVVWQQIIQHPTCRSSLCQWRGCITAQLGTFLCVLSRPFQQAAPLGLHPLQQANPPALGHVFLQAC